MTFAPSPNGTHCENCGAPDPQTSQGYTTCCNELVCDGSHQDVWVIGTLVYQRATGRDGSALSPAG